MNLPSDQLARLEAIKLYCATMNYPNTRSEFLVIDEVVAYIVTGKLPPPHRLPEEK